MNNEVPPTLDPSPAMGGGEIKASSKNTSFKPDLGLYQSKYKLRAVLRKIPGIQNLSPNVLSLFAIVPGLIAAYCLFQGLWMGAIFTIMGRMVINTLDGLIAEEYNKTSHLGAYLNRLPGEFTDILILLGLAPHILPLSLVVLVVLTGWVQIFGLLGLPAGGPTQSVGPCGQTDRLAILIIGCILASFHSCIWPDLTSLMSLGCILTLVLRIQRSIKAIRQQDRPMKVTSF